MTFQPGKSGNVHGRPRGAKNRATLLLDRMAHDDAQSVLRAVLDKAKSGDLQAASTILARIWPARRGRPVTLDLPAINTASDVTAALAAVMAAIADGDITTTEAAELATLIESARKSIELADIERRLAALEGAHGEGH